MTTKENQTEKMETSTAGSTEKQANKSVLVSITHGAGEWALKILHHHKLSYKLVGSDQHNATLLQVNYPEEQQPGVNDLLNFLKFFESFVQALHPVYEAFLEELQKAFSQLKVERRPKKAFKAPELINSLTDGNEEGK